MDEGRWMSLADASKALAVTVDALRHRLLQPPDGSFLGGWGAGRLYDVRCDYDLMWAISIGLGVLAALINWPIEERPVERLALRPA